LPEPIVHHASSLLSGERSLDPLFPGRVDELADVVQHCPPRAFVFAVEHEVEALMDQGVLERLIDHPTFCPDGDFLPAPYRLSALCPLPLLFNLDQLSTCVPASDVALVELSEGFFYVAVDFPSALLDEDRGLCGDLSSYLGELFGRGADLLGLMLEESVCELGGIFELRRSSRVEVEGGLQKRKYFARVRLGLLSEFEDGVLRHA